MSNYVYCSHCKYKGTRYTYDSRESICLASLKRKQFVDKLEDCALCSEVNKDGHCKSFTPPVQNPPSQDFSDKMVNVLKYLLLPVLILMLLIAIGSLCVFLISLIFK